MRRFTQLALGPLQDSLRALDARGRSDRVATPHARLPRDHDRQRRFDRRSIDGRNAFRAAYEPTLAALTTTMTAAASVVGFTGNSRMRSARPTGRESRQDLLELANTSLMAVLVSQVGNDHYAVIITISATRRSPPSMRSAGSTPDMRTDGKALDFTAARLLAWSVEGWRSLPARCCQPVDSVDRVDHLRAQLSCWPSSGAADLRRRRGAQARSPS